jgi:hypothetical protein
VRTIREIEAAIQCYESAAEAHARAHEVYLAACLELTVHRVVGYRLACAVLAGKSVVSDVAGERAFWKAEANQQRATAVLNEAAAVANAADRMVRDLLGELAALSEYPRQLRVGKDGDYFAEGVRYAVVWKTADGWCAKARWLPDAPLMERFPTAEAAATAIDAVLVTP